MKHISNRNLLVYKDLPQSVYELLFLDMAGIGGVFSNGVTWYISSMVLVIILCYPLLIKYKTTYTSLIAPIISILCLSILWNNTGRLSVVHETIFGVYKGLWRGFLSINLGISLYPVVKLFRAIFEQSRIRKNLRNSLSILQLWFLYEILRYEIQFINASRDYYILALIYVILVITFSEKTWLNQLTNMSKKLVPFLGSLSLNMYLFQNLISDNADDICKNLCKGSYKIFVIVYIGGIMFVSFLISTLNQRVLNSRNIKGMINEDSIK